MDDGPHAPVAPYEVVYTIGDASQIAAGDNIQLHRSPEICINNPSAAPLRTATGVPNSRYCFTANLGAAPMATIQDTQRPSTGHARRGYMVGSGNRAVQCPADDPPFGLFFTTCCARQGLPTARDDDPPLPLCEERPFCFSCRTPAHLVGWLGGFPCEAKMIVGTHFTHSIGGGSVRRHRSTAGESASRDAGLQ